MKWASPKYSLRFKLIVASIIVEIIMFSILVANSVYLTGQSQVQHAQLRVNEVTQLLKYALSAPLVEKDHARLQEILDNTRHDNGIAYLVLYDNKTIVASSGWNKEEALPLVETDIAIDTNKNPDRFDSKLPIQYKGRKYGTLYFGISTGFLFNARQRMLNQGALIAIVGIILSIVVMAVVGAWLVRQLVRLNNASRKIAEGDYDIDLPVKSQDEAGQLTQAFNNMSVNVRTRIKELENSEEQFHAIADYSYDWESWHGPNSNLIWVNPSVSRMTGYTVEECLGMEQFPYSIITEEDRPKAAELMKIAKNGSTGCAEFRIRRKDGTEFQAQACWQSIFDSEQQYLGIRSSIREVAQPPPIQGEA